MKRLITIIILLIVFTGSIKAQDRAHEISVSVGAGTIYDFLELYSDVFATVFTLGYYQETNQTNSPAIGVSYKYYLTKRFSLGGDFTYQSMTADAVTGGNPAGTIDKAYYSLAARADFNYIAKPVFKLYSGIGLGYCQYNQKYSPIDGGSQDTSDAGLLAVQLNAIGLKFGGKLGGFLELGYGYRGVVNVGLFAAF